MNDGIVLAFHRIIRFSVDKKMTLFHAAFGSRNKHPLLDLCFCRVAWPFLYHDYATSASWRRCHLSQRVGNAITNVADIRLHISQNHYQMKYISNDIADSSALHFLEKLPTLYSRLTFLLFTVNFDIYDVVIRLFFAVSKRQWMEINNLTFQSTNSVSL